VEDAGVTFDELRQHFGNAVAEIVAGCSEPDKSLSRQFFEEVSEFLERRQTESISQLNFHNPFSP
jgi:(p)ppGpp synthase/HD superfamily hydrolase